MKKPTVDTASRSVVEIKPRAHGAQAPFGCVLDIEPMTQEKKERVNWMLSHLKPLDEWLATTDPERLNACSDILGEPVEFYNRFRAELEKLAAEGGA